MGYPRTLQAAKFDAERGVSLTSLAGEPPSADAASLEEVTARLDLTIYYLRRVHLFDYYAARQFTSLSALVRACGQYIVRPEWDESYANSTCRHRCHRTAPACSVALTNALLARLATTGAAPSVQTWEKTLDTKVGGLLQAPLSDEEAAAFGLRSAAAYACAP